MEVFALKGGQHKCQATERVDLLRGVQHLAEVGQLVMRPVSYDGSAASGDQGRDSDLRGELERQADR